jgi:EmrB/QacA subfamily drug resistance transporter
MRITDANRKWWTLAAMTGGLSMIFIDQTIVGVTLPTIGRELDMSQVELQWVVNAFLLTLAAFVAAGGRLADMFGRRRMFVIGAAVFVAFSALCGAAQSDGWLIAARAGQGIGGAMLMPSTMAIVMTTFPPDDRGRALGLLVGIASVFLSVGPLLGGVLTEAISWRWIFFVNLPVGVVTILLTLRAAPESREKGARLDIVGFVLLATGITAVVLALMQGKSWGWGSAPTVGLLVGGALLLAGFVIAELRIAQPLLDLTLFRNRTFTGGNVVITVLQFALVGLTIFGPMFEENILGYAPIAAGALFLPATLPILFVAPFAGRLTDRIGPRWPALVGLLLSAAGLVEIALVADGADRFLPLLPGYLLFGIGTPLVLTPMSTASINAAPPQQRGEASGVISTTRQIGAALGIAVMGAIIAAAQQTRLDETLAGHPFSPEQREKLESLASGSGALAKHIAGFSAEQVQKIDAGAKAAFTDGFTTSMWVSAVVLLGAAVAGWFLIKPGRDIEDAPPPEGPGVLAAASPHPGARHPAHAAQS